jgi:uncharacterized membrane protein
MLPATESFGRLACLAGMCVAFAGIGMQHFTRHFIYFDALSHLTLHFAIAVIAFGWAFLLPRYRLLSAVAMMVLGMLALGMWVNIHPRELPPRGQDVPEGYRELRVMSFNTWIWNKEQEAIRVEIERQDPDIVFLAEVTSHDLAMSAELLAAVSLSVPRTAPARPPPEAVVALSDAGPRGQGRVDRACLSASQPRAGMGQPDTDRGSHPAPAARARAVEPDQCDCRAHQHHQATAACSRRLQFLAVFVHGLAVCRHYRHVAAQRLADMARHGAWLAAGCH